MTIGTGTGGAGLYTNGMTVVGGGSLSGSSLVPVDTNLPAGRSPQTAGIIPGTLPAPSANIGVTATAGGTKAAAYALDYGASKVSTCATNNDSVLLPYAYPGAVCVIYNAGAATLAVFGKGTDTVNAVATGTANTLATGVSAVYVGMAGSGDGTDAGNWARVMSA
jgi:hypothetical protein